MASNRETIVDQFSKQAVPFSTARPIRDAEAVRRLVEASGAGPGDAVLDVACGPGIVVCGFAPHVRSAVGIDVTRAMLARGRKLAREAGVANAAWICGDVAALPYADGEFPIVVSRLAFHHFPQPAAVLAEMRRVCRPGGTVVVADLLASPDPERAAAFHAMEVLRDPSHARALTLEDLRALFAGAGLSPARETGYDMDLELEALLARSFPAPGDAARIRAMFEAAVDGDRFGIGLHRRDGGIWFRYRVAILSATAPRDPTAPPAALPSARRRG